MEAVAILIISIAGLTLLVIAVVSFASKGSHQIVITCKISPLIKVIFGTTLCETTINIMT